MILKNRESTLSETGGIFQIVGERSLCIVHDLLTPVSVLSNCLELIETRYGNDSFIADDILTMKKQIKKITKHINYTLDSLKSLSISLGTHDVGKIIADVVNDLMVSEEIKIELCGNLIVPCDPMKIDTLFSNLITNSIQALPSQIDKIKVRAKEYDMYVKIEIEDAGPEIPTDVIENMFKPLFTTKPTGTGLGLVSCRHIVEEHRGTLSVRTNPTTFTVTLPKILSFDKAVNEHDTQLDST